jgi:heavy metal translocating P-type ATPase
MARTLCHHCGLPTAAAPRADEDRVFCCYGCYLAWRIVGEQEGAGQPASLLARLGVAGILAMNVMMLSILLYSDALAGLGPQAMQAFRWILLLLSTPVLLILGLPHLVGAARELRRGLPSTDSLVALGAFTGFGVSAAHVWQGRGHIYFDTATMLLVLVTLGRLLEASAKVEASRHLKSLLTLTPPRACLLRGEEEVEVPAESLLPGDRVRVRPAERLPADGVILSGLSSVQEAALTGESLPRAVQPGDPVFGGSVNGEAELLVEVRTAAPDSLVAQIGRLVTEAQHARAPVERLVARISTVFVPLVLALAAGAFVYGRWRSDAAHGAMAALAVLVVACPCALGLATPLAITAALSRAAQQAVLIRTGEVLEVLSRVTLVFLDKTGTLTRGEPVVRALHCVDGCPPEEALAWLASLETGSEHVLARAIAQEATRQEVALGRVTGFRTFPGGGATGEVTRNGAARQVWAGTPGWLQEQGLSCQEADGFPAPAATATCLYLAWGGQVRARVDLADHLRPDAPEAVAELRRAGLDVVILSGDRQSVADEVAAQLGGVPVKAECTPARKLAEVQAATREGHVVAMVGDGINDAPALAEADVGIAMGSGTDLAREVGGLALLGDGLLRLPWVIGLARRTYRTIARNLAWAFGYNLLAVAAAFFGYLHPLLAALAMLGSSLFVLHNSLRLARHPGPD